jgi:DNA segregation ATPase FtsK/SpoIIIE, S-DNA-T family
VVYLEHGEDVHWRRIVLRKWIMKNRLKNAFKIAELHHTRKRRNHEVKSYPYLVDFRENDMETVYVFKLPLGLNPKEVSKKEYIFSQVFGHNYVLEGDGLTFTLKVITKKSENDFMYDWSFVAPHLQGHDLPIVAGMDHLGKFHVYDMVKNPHLLIAGETGSGKSVTVRAIITTILLHMKDRVDLYLGDMKRSEFHVFRNVDGVQAVITKKPDLYKCLTWVSNEMKRRGDLLDMFEVEHINEYNKLPKVPFEKFIVLAIDEVALLKKDKELMDIVEEVSCIGRALGVFLILSMQRPDAKVLEGQLKNNLTVRYAFKHSDKINSDITLGRGHKFDASKISNGDKGKFIYKNEIMDTLQAPFLPLPKARELLDPWKRSPDAREVNVEPFAGSENDFMELPLLFEEDEDEQS